MSDPTPFVPDYSYTGFAAGQGTNSFPGTQIDADFAEVQITTDQTIEALADVRRSDGQLVNGIVTVDSLAPGLTLGFTLRGDWVIGTHYLTGDGVFYAGRCYRANAAHDATNTNRPDVDAATWIFLYSTSDLTGTMQVATYDPTHIAADVFNRANHTGAQAISTVTGLQGALDTLTVGVGSKAAITSVDGKTIYAAKAVNYTAVLADNNAAHRFTAAATVALTAAATLGPNWHYTVTADGGAVTIDPNASETINGAATLTVPMGSSAKIICDGSNFFTVFKPALWEPVGTGTYSFSGVTQWVLTDLGAYETIRFTGSLAFSLAAAVVFAVSANNGSTFDSTASDYLTQVLSSFGTTVAGAVSPITASLPLCNGHSLDANNYSHFEATFFKLNKATPTRMKSSSGHIQGGSFTVGQSIGSRQNSVAHNALKLIPNTGVMTGFLTVEGIRG